MTDEEYREESTQEEPDMLDSFLAAYEKFCELYGRGTQRRIAEDTGLGTSKTSGIMKRKRTPSFKSMRLISNWFGYDDMSFVEIGRSYLLTGRFIPVPPFSSDRTRLYENLCRGVSEAILQCGGEIEIRPGPEWNEKFKEYDDLHAWFFEFMNRSKEIIASANTNPV